MVGCCVGGRQSHLLVRQTGAWRVKETSQVDCY